MTRAELVAEIAHYEAEAANPGHHPVRRALAAEDVAHLRAELAALDAAEHAAWDSGERRSYGLPEPAPVCVGCGVLLTGAELQDEGRDECESCTRWATSHEPAEQPETLAEAVCVLRELAAALDQTAPIVDAVPFTLRGEARKDDGRRAVRLPW